MALPKVDRSEAEYLEFERGSELKHEFVNGYILAMTGASEIHNAIVASMIVALGTQLRHTQCRILSSDMRVFVPDHHDYVYPDVVVVCGESEHTDDTFDTLANPTVVIEVLSPSTEAYDRGLKFEKYRQIKTLQTYILVAQDRHRIEWFSRQDTDSWLFHEAEGLDSSFELSGVGCSIALAEVYEQVNF